MISQRSSKLSRNCKRSWRSFKSSEIVCSKNTDLRFKISMANTEDSLKLLAALKHKRLMVTSWTQLVWLILVWTVVRMFQQTRILRIVANRLQINSVSIKKRNRSFSEGRKIKQGMQKSQNTTSTTLGPFGQLQLRNLKTALQMTEIFSDIECKDSETQGQSLRWGQFLLATVRDFKA